MKDCLIASQRPEKMTPSIIPFVKVKRGVDTPAPGFAPSFAFGDLKGITNEMDEAQSGKDFQRGHVRRFQKSMIGFKVRCSGKTGDVVALLGEQRPDALHAACMGIVNGWTEHGGVAPIEKRFVAAGALREVVL